MAFTMVCINTKQLFSSAALSCAPAHISQCSHAIKQLLAVLISEHLQIESNMFTSGATCISTYMY